MATKARTLTKRAVIQTLKELPERFNADELIERILVLQKIEEGLEDAKAGRTYTLAEMRAHVEQKWSK